MLTEFIDFVDSVLPSVSPDLRDSAKSAILQFERTGETLKYMMLNPLKELSQGDIISKVPFSFFDESGSQKLFIADALVLSTSCHIDQKDKILLAPVFPLDAFDGNLTDLKRNIIYDYMYLPDPVLSDKFIDFEYINTYHTDLIRKRIADGKITRMGSLNQLGYYFFLVKLTVYLMRKEDGDTLSERNFSAAYS